VTTVGPVLCCCPASVVPGCDWISPCSLFSPVSRRCSCSASASASLSWTWYVLTPKYVIGGWEERKLPLKKLTPPQSDPVFEFVRVVCFVTEALIASPVFVVWALSRDWTTYIHLQSCVSNPIRVPVAITRFLRYSFGLPTVHRVSETLPRSAEARAIIVFRVRRQEKVRFLPSPRTLLRRCYRDCKFPAKSLSCDSYLLVVCKALLSVEVAFFASSTSTLKRHRLNGA
jgi:hypothetical protein